MGNIISISNFNKYTGRYARGARASTPEEEIGWYLHYSILEKVPALAWRRACEDNDFPLSWKNGRNLTLAVEHSLATLKAWQAFRPMAMEDLRADLLRDVPRRVLTFQEKLATLDVTRVRDVCELEQEDYDELVFWISDTVAYLSSWKTFSTPMLGSKLMHFLVPEFFPMWDGAWIRDTALVNEDLSDKALGIWLSEKVRTRLSKTEHGPMAIEYARYLALMLKDLDETDEEEYANVQAAFVKHSEVDEHVVNWFFGELTPLVFERCLLGKHNG